MECKNVNDIINDIRCLNNEKIHYKSRLSLAESVIAKCYKTGISKDSHKLITEYYNEFLKEKEK